MSTNRIRAMLRKMQEDARRIHASTRVDELTDAELDDAIALSFRQDRGEGLSHQDQVRLESLLARLPERPRLKELSDEEAEERIAELLRIPGRLTDETDREAD